MEPLSCVTVSPIVQIQVEQGSFMMIVDVNRNVWRQILKLAKSRNLDDESDLVNAVLREYVERETGFDFTREPPAMASVVESVLELKPVITEQGVESISLFGSTLRENANADSDIDFIIDLVPEKRGSLTPVRKVREILEDRFDRAVDVIARGCVNSNESFRDGAGATARKIF